jgi:2-methylcitrate dehydratase PrpD
MERTVKAPGLLAETVAHLQRSYAATDVARLNAPSERALLDFVLCAAAGVRVAQRWASLAGVGEGEGAATILGLRRKAPMAAAAACNAAAAHSSDLDDLHWPSLTHPGAFVWPVVLALAEGQNLGGAEALKAAVLGYECIARLAEALGPSHRRFFHASTTAGVVGATLAGALLAGLDAGATAWAMGHAVSVAPALGQHLVEHSGTGPFHRLAAVQVAFAAVAAAKGGLAGDAFGLEGVRGLFAATCAAASTEPLLRPVASWAVEEISLRAFRTTGYAHAAMEAAFSLGPLEPESVDEVVAEVPQAALAAAGNPEPKDARQAWWSMPHALAVAFVTQDPLRLDDPSLLEEERVVRLREKIRLHGVEEAGPPRPYARLMVRLADGRTATRLCEAPRGHPRAPWGEEGWRQKRDALGLCLTDSGLIALRALAADFHTLPVPVWLREAGEVLATAKP